jgi:molybdenum cofactor biosynthesis enzyme MoaA
MKFNNEQQTQITANGQIVVRNLSDFLKKAGFESVNDNSDSIKVKSF